MILAQAVEQAEYHYSWPECIMGIGIAFAVAWVMVTFIKKVL